MKKNTKQFFRKPVVKTMKCTCGKVLIQKTRRNYPFGMKSKSVTTQFYKCSECGYRSN